MLALDARSLKKAFERNLPTILSGVAVVGVIGTVVLAVKATPQAHSVIAEAKDDDAVELAVHDDTLTAGMALERVNNNWTVVKSVRACWRCYIPTALTGTATIACILGANVIGLRRNAALLAAYTLADTSFREYKDKVVEHITTQKAQKIDDEIMADKINNNPPPANTTYVFDGGDQLCYESLTGRYFKSSAEKIRRAAQDIDARILQGDMYASLNEFFEELGLDTTQLGELMGFNIECRLKVVFSVHLNECDQACLAVGYEKLPVYNYDTI